MRLAMNANTHQANPGGLFSLRLAAGVLLGAVERQGLLDQELPEQQRHERDEMLRNL